MTEMDSNVAKSLANVAEKAADLFHKFAAPAAEEIGGIIGDKMKLYRLKNWISTAQKAVNLLREAGVAPKAVPPKLLLPIIESCSVEEDRTLQEMWAGLLATASQETDSVSPSFAETLKQMTPGEAKCIDEIYGNRTNPNKPHLALGEQLGLGNFRDKASVETYERLGIIRREYGLTREGGETEVGSLLRFTKYGVAFLAACRGPRSPVDSNRDPTTMRP